MTCMRSERRLHLIVIIALCLLLTHPGAVSGQGPRPLTFGQPVTGTVLDGASEDWTLTLPAGAVISLFARSTDGTLDPVLSLLNGDTLIISNDDYAYPDTRDAGLQAVTVPSAGSYTVRVSAFGATVGSYSLVALPGYGDLAWSDELDTVGAWTPVTDTGAVTLASADGQLEMTVTGLEQSALLVNDESPQFNHYAARLGVASIQARGTWQIGLAASVIGEEAYIFELASDGLWRVTRRSAGTFTTLRDWSAHPAIVVGQTAFWLGVMVNGSTIEFFYNDQFIGSIQDASLSAAGRVGVYARTGSALDSQLRLRLNDITLTTPVEPAILPQQVLVSSDSVIMTRELERRGLIPPTEPSFNVAESFVELGRAGVNALQLARGQTFERFAYAADLTWESSYAGAPVGCGLVFGYQNDSTYSLAFVMQSGAYGLSPRAGAIFAPGLGGTLATPSSSHHVLVVATDAHTHYYIDGQLMGTLPNGPTTVGGVGIAVVNDQPLDTTCRYQDLWLASF